MGIIVFIVIMFIIVLIYEKKHKKEDDDISTNDLLRMYDIYEETRGINVSENNYDDDINIDDYKGDDPNDF